MEKKYTKFSFFDFLAIIIKYKKMVVAVTGIAAVLIVALNIIARALPSDSFLNPFPDYFEPQACLSAEGSGESISSKLGGGVMNLLLGTSGATKNPQLELAQNILEGNIVKDKIIDEFDFFTKYKLTAQPNKRSAARVLFTENLSVGFPDNPASTIFTIGYRDIDAAFAANILNRVIELLNDRFKELTLTQLIGKKEFIESRIAEAETELKKAQKDLVDFQLKYNIIDISSQANKQTEFMGSLSAEILRDELELQTLREYLPESSTKVVLLKKEIEKKKSLINELKTGLGRYSDEFIPQNSIPGISTQFVNKKAELEVLTKMYGVLREQYEMVKIDLADNSKVLHIIEPAEVLEKKSGPARGVMCIFATAAAFILAIGFAFIKEFFLTIKKDPQEAEKIDYIKQNILKWKQ